MVGMMVDGRSGGRWWWRIRQQMKMVSAYAVGSGWRCAFIVTSLAATSYFDNSS